MHSQVVMEVLDRAAHAEEHFQPLVDRQPFLVRIIRDGLISYILQDQVAMSVTGQSTIEALCDIWMIEWPESVGFVRDAMSVQGTQNLNCQLLRDHSVTSARSVNLAHTTAADQFLQPQRSKYFANSPVLHQWRLASTSASRCPRSAASVVRCSRV